MRLSEKQINEKLISIMRLIKFPEWTTPENDTEEKKRFFKSYASSRVYNPQYNYKKPKSLKRIREMSLELKNILSEKLYLGIIRRILLKIEFIESIGDDDKQVFTDGHPDPAMVALAKATIPKQKGRMQKRNISSKDAKTSFLEYLKGYGLRDWKVRIKRKMIAKANVDTSKKTLHIAERNYSLHEINNLISHEIEVHVIRAVNGYRQKSAIFASGTNDYLRTEEGLAIMMEQLTGNYNPQRFRFFAARIIAADMALSKSFYEIFDVLHRRYHLSKNNAYIITKRVKRSLKDTSKPGGYIKDHVYFEGFHMIKSFMQSGGDIRPLFAGKISLKDLALVKRGVLKKPVIIPRAVEAHYQYRSEQKVLA